MTAWETNNVALLVHKHRPSPLVVETAVTLTPLLPSPSPCQGGARHDHPDHHALPPPRGHPRFIF